jgi:hypothetical protein
VIDRWHDRSHGRVSDKVSISVLCQSKKGENQQSFFFVLLVNSSMVKLSSLLRFYKRIWYGTDALSNHLIAKRMKHMAYGQKNISNNCNIFLVKKTI